MPYTEEELKLRFGLEEWKKLVDSPLQDLLKQLTKDDVAATIALNQIQERMKQDAADLSVKTQKQFATMHDEQKRELKPTPFNIDPSKLVPTGKQSKSKEDEEKNLLKAYVCRNCGMQGHSVVSCTRPRKPGLPK